jgi:hypothetical protein
MGQRISAFASGWLGGPSLANSGTAIRTVAVYQKHGIANEGPVAYHKGVAHVE